MTLNLRRNSHLKTTVFIIIFKVSFFIVFIEGATPLIIILLLVCDAFILLLGVYFKFTGVFYERLSFLPFITYIMLWIYEKYFTIRL